MRFTSASSLACLLFVRCWMDCRLHALLPPLLVVSLTCGDRCRRPAVRAVPLCCCWPLCPHPHKAVHAPLPRLHAAPFACSEMPGELQKVLEWFRDYKIPDGKVRLLLRTLEWCTHTCCC